MKFLLSFISIFLIVINYIFSQKPDLTNEMLYLQESNYLHLNKPYYYKGERLWFKAYMLYADNSLADTLSKVLYSELLNPSGTIIQKQIHKINKNAAEGDFWLPDTLKSGNYWLRVYTNWMRNYGEENLQYYPIRVFDFDQIPITNAGKLKKCDYLVSINDTLKINNNIELKLTIPNIKQFSISITDTNYVKRLQETYNSKIASSFSPERQFDIKYPLERDLYVKGALLTRRNKKIKFTAMRKSDNEFSDMETDENGAFSIAWDGEKSSDIMVINAETKAQTKLLDTLQVLPKIVLPFARSVAYLSSKAPYFSKDTVEKDAILLNSVEVKGKTIEEKFSKVNRLYGAPDNVVSGEEILKSQVSNPLLALQSKVPGVKVTVGPDGNVKIDIRSSSTTSFTGDTSPLILLDGMPFSGDASSISLASINRIEIVKRVSAIMGARGVNGIVNIITNQQGNKSIFVENPDDNHVFTIPIKGFDKNHDFQNNDAQLLWETNIKPTEEGDLFVKFNSGKRKAVYQIELIGILTNGNLIKCYKYIIVN